MDPRRDALIREHLSLVDHVVRRASGSFPPHVDRQDLVAAGRLGLTEAALRYDFERSIPFAPYAARRIRGAVMDLMRSQDWVPRRVRDTVRDATVTTASLERRLGRAPEDVEVAAAMGIEIDELRSSRLAARHSTVDTLDRATSEEGPTEVVDQTQLSIEEMLEHRELRGYVRAALDSLPERLRLIVVGHYIEGRSLDELAAFLRLTPSRISQLKSDAIEAIRNGVDAQFRQVEDDDQAPPKGRAAIRRARYAAAIAEHADWRSRLLTARPPQSGFDASTAVDRSA